MCCSILQKVADPKNNIPMHFLWRGIPDKEEKKKHMEVGQFRVREEKDVGAGEDVLFQNTGATIQMRISIVIFLSSYI